ncbi:uncharacterized protein LOC105916453 isoform X2 [Fundulus heteroclitus]|uniref:uncharacterized protein LOC105916453 isoform X2 n=1 Tax=Fundulus heteroclitus TaxID=8078 RepID=UPI00165B5B72|nr:uncharacterized protein LOC105916453 isoform X2 [Fundulus heteroclitus]
MASGFCVSMLMLSLITVGMHAAGNVHRYGSKTVRPHSAQAGTLPRSYRPAPSSYEGSLRPRASVASSKIPGRLSAESSKPWGSVAGHGQSGYGRQVNSYSQPRSVSSYRSTSVLTPQQQPQARVYQRPSVREPSSQGEKRYGSSVVSSGAIEIRAPEKPSQVPSSSPGTGVRKTKAKTLDSVNAQLAKSPGSAAQPPKNHPAFSAPAVLQTNKAMWGSINAPSAKSPASTVQRHKRPSSVPGVLQANPGQLPIYTSSATSPHSTSQRHQKPSPFSAPVVQQTNQRWGGMFSNPRSSRPVASGYYRGLQSGHPAARQQERMLTRQPMHLGSPATSVRQNKDVSSFPQMKPGLRSSRPVNMASLYQHGGRLPQLSYNRD